MQKLSQPAFRKARHFMNTRARPLERALFAFRFEGAPPEAVVKELVPYQNDDGGFGHALEPDVRTPTSSAIATNNGLRLLQELNCPADHPMVSQACRYLLAAFDDNFRSWRLVPPDANDFPHAGWWHDEDGQLARTFNDFTIIPRAELVALLHHYAANVPAGWLDDLAEETVAHLEAHPPAFGDELVFALRLAEAQAVPLHFRQRLLPRLRAITPAIVEREPRKWQEYCLPPVAVAPTPQSAVAHLLWGDIQAHLDYLVAQQTTAGAWEPFWTWGEAYPQAWEQAKEEWRGHLTLETLTTLSAYGRIESVAQQK